MQKDSPPEPNEDIKPDLERELEADEDAYRDKWGIPTPPEKQN